MKKDIFHLGGHRVKTNDVDHLQNSLIEIAEALTKGLGLDTLAGPLFPMVLTGVKKSGTLSAVTWTSGYVFYNGEVFETKEQLTQIDGNLYDFYIVETFLPGNPVLYKDGTPQNVHVTRTLEAKLVSGEPGPGVITVADAFNYIEDLRLEKVLSNKLIDEGQLISSFYAKGWTNTGLVINDPQIAIRQDFQYRIIGDFVELRGDFEKFSGTWGNFASIPAEAYPAEPQNISVAIGSALPALPDPVKTDAALLIDNSGLTILNGGLALDDRLTITNIRYKRVI